ncbi:hypothetical protein HDU96_010629 [Phlyctochytrium bullatum]|nr:hypothetical protein HDU96_010629 [Phlyctochytrium bullatum]
MAVTVTHLDCKIIFFFTFLAGCTTFPWVSLIYQDLLHFSKAEIGILQALTPGVALLSAPGWTYVVDFLNRRIAVLVVTSIGAVAIQWGYLIPNLTFSGACLVAAAQSFFAAPVFPLVDALVLDYLEEDKDAYGQQRLWAAISCGISYVITAQVMKSFGGYWVVFPLQTVWTLLYIVVLLYVVTTRKQGPKSAEVVDVEGADAETPAAPSAPATTTDESAPLLAQPANAPVNALSYKWIASTNTLVFLLCMAILGSAFSVVQSFLFLYLREYKHATGDLLGLTGPFTIAIELPFFFFSKQILQRIGLKNCIILGHLAMLARVLLYTIIPDWPWTWVVLGVELLHGLSFSLMWTAGVRFASAISPPNMSTTAQGLLAAAHFGLGFGFGAIAAGYVYGSYGPLVMFRGSAATLAFSVVLMWLFVKEPIRN